MHSVDAKTDARIQQLIRAKFPSHTIVMISHRLSTLLDFDRVVVLEGGRMVDFGKPAELLTNRESHFARAYHGSTA